MTRLRVSTMSLEERYIRFREFVSTHIPLEPINFALQMMPSAVFMETIRRLLDARPNIAPADIGPLVIEGLGIEPTKFDKPTHMRFGLYCEYFAEMSRVANAPMSS